MCSRSSITTSSTLAASTATPRRATDPVRRIEHGQDDVEIVVYNRAVPT